MSKSITLNHITKIEGHAKLNLGIEKNKVTRCELSATEGSRYFEGIVIGRNYTEAHELTSRICGICSCAHVIAAITAIENAIGFIPSKQTIMLRELMTLGERIRSHATHLYFLALPDYVGYESALAMIPKFKPQLNNALLLMKHGNRIIKTLAARDLHPVSATVGGWLKLPTEEQFTAMLHDLEALREPANATVKLFSSLEYPSFDTSGEMGGLKDAKKYAMLGGTFASEFISFSPNDYRRYLTEEHREYSSSNFVTLKGNTFMVGALSRFNLSARQLHPKAQAWVKKSKLRLPSENPYLNNLAQAIEMVHCIEEGIILCKKMLREGINQERHAVPKPKAGVGVGAIEVPRGTLWHEYAIDSKGRIVNANIITPTAQNLFNIQEDIRNVVPGIVHKKKEEIIMDIEKLIRSYDPCFSCSAHFLEVKWT
ncbi:MAG TPA: Ni/Fe hydrogenase subunit alpha [Candidatus Nanoarchaeia archaeon]|nr:Ni/Fe hydrogenase subunit alpha [Candidatus Nanoarchaeia archaeon]